MKVLKYISGLRVRIKLLFAFGSLIILSAALVLIFFMVLKRNNLFQQASENIDALNISLLEMDGDLKYFMYEGYKDEHFQKAHKNFYLDAYRENLSLFKENSGHLRSNALDIGDSLRVVDNLLSNLDSHFKALQHLFIVRGFKDFGLEGRLRQAIHAVENSSSSFDKTEMLMLRRHEKDFFLRKDLKYQQEFNKRIDTFSENLKQRAGGTDDGEIINNLDKYKTLFNEVVKTESQIGLKDSDGYKGIINTDLTRLKRSIATMREVIKASSIEFKERSKLLLFTIFMVQLVLGVALAVIYSNLVTRAIKELQRAMEMLSEGIFPKPLVVWTRDEIGKTKTAFNQLLDRMKAAAKFSESLGGGNLAARYEERFSEDILAKSMTKMQNQLKEALDKQNIISWANQGSAMLNDILKNENEDMEMIGDKLMKLLVQYLNANQGALYVLQGDEMSGVLVRISTYAYEKKRFVSATVNIGEGLVGECFLQKQEIILTQVPMDYIRITSGLGEAVPHFVIIVPLVIQGRAKGVIELASFAHLEPYKVEFLKKISENIASILVNKQVNSETRRLLTQARERQQRLAESEEEFRQNAEAMQAVQEQMMLQRQSLEQEILFLKELVREKEAVVAMEKFIDEANTIENSEALKPELQRFA